MRLRRKLKIEEYVGGFRRASLSSPIAKAFAAKSVAKGARTGQLRRRQNSELSPYETKSHKSSWLVLMPSLMRFILPRCES